MPALPSPCEAYAATHGQRGESWQGGVICLRSPLSCCLHTVMVTVCPWWSVCPREDPFPRRTGRADAALSKRFVFSTGLTAGRAVFSSAALQLRAGYDIMSRCG